MIAPKCTKKGIDFCVWYRWIGFHDQVTHQFVEFQVSQTLLILFW